MSDPRLAIIPLTSVLGRPQWELEIPAGWERVPASAIRRRASAELAGLVGGALQRAFDRSLRRDGTEAIVRQRGNVSLMVIVARRFRAVASANLDPIARQWIEEGAEPADPAGRVLRLRRRHLDRARGDAHQAEQHYLTPEPGSDRTVALHLAASAVSLEGERGAEAMLASLDAMASTVHWIVDGAEAR